MTRIALIFASGVGLALAGGCETDTNGGGGVSETTPISGPTASSGVGEDAAFMRSADIINSAEVEIGQLALERGEHPDVKRFAEMLVNDHRENREQLQELASTQEVELPTGLDQKHRQLIDRLSGLRGAEFDRAFINEMVTGHQDAVNKFEEEVRTGRDPQVKSYAANTLPVLRHHLQFAKDIQSRLDGDMGSGMDDMNSGSRPHP